MAFAASVARLALPLAEGVKANLVVAHEHLGELAKRHPGHTELAIAGSRLHRSAGELASAQALVEALPPSWGREVELAGIAREDRRWDDALAALERAHQMRPDDVASLLDIGQLCLQRGHLDRAREAYRQAHQLDADSVWAAAGARYACWLSGESLAEPIRVVSDDAAADDWAQTLERDITAYATRLPDPVDPTIGVLRQLPIQLSDTTDPAQRIDVKVLGDRPLAPSSRLVFKALLAAHERKGELTVETDQPRSLPWTPWNAPARPPEALAASLTRIAASRFDLDAWSEAAATLGASHHTEALRDATVWLPLEGHPDPCRRLHGVQLVAALAIASRPDPVRSRVAELTAMLAARDDWVSAAAAVGLWRLAETEPATRDTVLAALAVEAEVDPPPVSARAVGIALRSLGTAESRSLASRTLARLR